MIPEPAEVLTAKKRRAADHLRSALEIVALTLLAALFLKFFIVEAYRIPTSSMENTLMAGDFVLCKMLAAAKMLGRLPSKRRRCPRERSLSPIVAI